MDIVTNLIDNAQGTRIPCIFVLAGVVLILFPFAGDFKGRIVISRSWQKLAGILGFLLLASGLFMVFAVPADNAPDQSEPLAAGGAAPRVIADPFGADDLNVLKEDIAYLQIKAINALHEGRLQDADNALLEAEALINYALNRSPDDRAILNQAGCLHRNVALVYERFALDEQVAENLSDAAHSFRLMISFDYQDASAWKSLGDVYILRDELDQAESCVRTAMELDPDYEAAQHDLTWILEHR